MCEQYIVEIEHKSSSLERMLHMSGARYEVQSGQIPDILSHTERNKSTRDGHCKTEPGFWMAASRCSAQPLHGFSSIGGYSVAVAIAQPEVVLRGGIVRLGCDCDLAGFRRHEGVFANQFVEHS